MKNVQKGFHAVTPPGFSLRRTVMMQASTVWSQVHSIQFNKYLFNSLSGHGISNENSAFPPV